MPSFLPREWGEAGALRVSDIGDRVRRKDCNESIQRWIRETYGDKDVAANKAARELRALNQRRFLASLARTQRPARVS